ncbi:DMT family transporter [Kiloniella sp. b19]|uniref:DMT family transporter n=1 Tax=Kiloniella sp. GXU_MW_B19 TaxID=3141326 RepID=UPI0031DDE4F5
MSVTSSRLSLGIALALLSALFFALVGPSSSYALGDGASPLSMTVGRFLIGAALTGGYMILTGQDFRIQKTQFPRLLFATAMLFLLTLAFLSAFEFIPVSLGVVIFYLYPLLVAVMESLFARKLPPLSQALLLLLAFAGVGIAVGSNLDLGNLSVDGTVVKGALWSAAAAVGLASYFLVVKPLGDVIPLAKLIFYVNALCLVLVIPYQLLTGSPVELPSTGFGISALSAIGIFYLFAGLIQVHVLKFMPASNAAMIYNAEPVFAVGLSIVVLGETPGEIQLLGSALVLIALVAFCLLNLRQNSATS